MNDMERTLSPTESGLIFDNRLPQGHALRPHLEDALRTALSDLPGSWKVSIIPFGRRVYNVEVVSPDGSRWSAAVPVPEGPPPQDVADMVRAACARRLPVKPPREASPATGTGHASLSGGAFLEPAVAGRGRT
jgi:hypothetical protein